MAIKIDALKKILKSFGMPDAQIDDIADPAKPEVDVELPKDRKIFTDAEIATLTNNIKTQAKTGHEEAYKEIFGKELNEKHKLGLTVTDAKDPEKLIVAMLKKAEADAGKAPDAKVKELTDAIEKLQNETIPNVNRERDEWKGKYTERQTFDKWAELIPETANPLLTREEHVNRVRKLYDINDAGNLVNKSDGKVVTDALANPVAAKDVIAETYTKNKGWEASQEQVNQFHHSTGGNGGGAGKGSFNHDATVTSLNAKYDRMTPESRLAWSQEYQVALANAPK